MWDPVSATVRHTGLCVCHKLCTVHSVMCGISADLLSIACRYSMCRALVLLAPAVAATEGSRSVE